MFVWLYFAVLSKIRKIKNVINIDCDTMHLFTNKLENFKVGWSPYEWNSSHMTKFQPKYTQCLDLGAHNPSAHMQETGVTELHSPATRVFNTLRPKKMTFRTAHSYVSFLRNLFRNFVNVLLKFKGYDKKDCVCSVKCWGDLGSDIHKPILIQTNNDLTIKDGHALNQGQCDKTNCIISISI